MQLMGIWGRTAAVALAAMLIPALIVVACQATPLGYERRMQDTYAFIDAWEVALEGGRDDRGWSMLSDSAQGAYESKEQYVALASAADWSAFDLVPFNGHCDDLVWCSISLRIPGGVASVPEFLVASPTGEKTRLVAFVDNDQDGEPDSPDSEFGNGWMQVWWERVPWPDPGIGGGGG